MAGSGGAARPGVVPGSWPSEIVTAAPAAHSASRLLTPKQPNAPAVASASIAGAGSVVRLAKSSRSAYGWPATMAVAAAEPRFRTPDSPSLIRAGPGGDPPEPPGRMPAGPGTDPPGLPRRPGRAGPGGDPPETPGRMPAGPGTDPPGLPRRPGRAGPGGGSPVTGPGW